MAYPIGVIALLHYFIQSKLNVSEPVFVSGLFVWLMLWRVIPEAWRRSRAIGVVAALYGGLAVASALMAAVVEVAWYGLVKHVDPWRVVAANETIARGLRPAHWVLVVAALVFVVVLVRRLQPLLRGPAKAVA